MEEVIIAASKKTMVLFFFGLAAVCLVALTSFTKYIYAKDYIFFIESTCNPEQQTCYVRDCEEFCPPNGLDIYNVYEITAYNFDQCTTNGCENICQNEATSNLCTEISCDAEAGDSCSDQPEE